MTSKQRELPSRLQPGDLVEILYDPSTGEKCGCGCGLHVGSQGVVVSMLYTSLISGEPCHDVQFERTHPIWVAILRKVGGPPSEILKSELDELLETY